MNGKLTTRNGIIYCILYYKDITDTFKQKWISTGLPERGNKKAALQILQEKLTEYAYLETENKDDLKNQPTVLKKTENILWLDWLEDYVNGIKDRLSPHEFHIYSQSYMNVCKIFWGSKKLYLTDITTQEILDFYNFLKIKRAVKNTTIKKYACVIRPALKKAFMEKKIKENPYDYMPTIKREKVEHSFYDQREMQNFFNLITGHKLELEFKILAYYGLRRSELVGIKWSSINFNDNTIAINHKVIVEEREIIVSNKMKTESSNRTLPLIPVVADMLLSHKAKIQRNMANLGKKYNRTYTDFVCVDDTGDLIKPDYISHEFSDFLKKNKLKKIRLHDLRHSCASIMLAKGVQMKQIQEWLGHSNFSTTADVYSHLDFSSKIDSARKISDALTVDSENKEHSDAQKLKILNEKAKELGFNSISEMIASIAQNQGVSKP